MADPGGGEGPSLEDIQLGKVAFCAPAPPAKRRRMSLPADLEGSARPWWAPERKGNSRADATAGGKRLICKAYQTLVGRAGAGAAPNGPGGPPLIRNEAWFDRRPRSQSREIAAALFGVSGAAAGR